jgi:hypothetical protein
VNTGSQKSVSESKSEQPDCRLYPEQAQIEELPTVTWNTFSQHLLSQTTQPNQSGMQPMRWMSLCEIIVIQC